MLIKYTELKITGKTVEEKIETVDRTKIIAENE